MDDAPNPAVGAELDAAVAREVFGIAVLGIVSCTLYRGEWRISTPQDRRRVACAVYSLERYCNCAVMTAAGQPLSHPELGHDRSCLRVVESYSTQMTAAWQVVEKLVQRGYQFSFDWSPTHWWPKEDEPMPVAERWGCFFTGIPGTDMLIFGGRYSAPAEAVCRAAMAVMAARGGKG